MRRRSFSFEIASALVAALLARGASAQAPVPTAMDVPRPPAQRTDRDEVPAAERMTLGGAVARALARNPDAREASEEIRRYRALTEQVRAASLPTLVGVGTYTQLDAARTLGAVVLAPQSGFNAGATFSVPLVNPTGWVKWGQASDQIDVARADAADVRRKVALATARAYLSVVAQRHLLQAATTARDNAKAHYDFTHAQLLGGAGNRLDQVRAAVELTTDEGLLQNEETALVRAREALGVLVGGEVPVDGDDETPEGAIPTLSDGLNESQRGRADVRARRRAATAADRAVDDAWADYVPYLSLVASPFYESAPVATVPQTGWQAALVLTLPLYDGGLRYGQERERRAVASERRLELEATLRQAKSEVRAAFEELARTDVAADQAHQAAAFAGQALELAGFAYRAGATTNLEVIDAERQARDAATRAAVADDASRNARLDLLAASGRFP